MKKGDLFSISEAAKVGGVTPRTLRHYETLGLLKPAYIDNDSGYRYYDAKNLERMVLILMLKSTGLSLCDIGNYLSGRISADKQLNVLIAQKAAIERSIAALEVHNVQKNCLDVDKIDLPERRCICRRVIAADIFDAAKACHDFYRECIRLGICRIKHYAAFCEYPPEAFSNDGLVLSNFPMTICVPADDENPPEGSVVYPACAAIVVNYRGDYTGLSSAYDALHRYMAKNRLMPDGNPQEVYLEGENNSILPRDEYVTRVMIPVKGD